MRKNARRTGHFTGGKMHKKIGVPKNFLKFSLYNGGKSCYTV